MSKLFINLSNHNSEYWSEKQIRDAQAYGEILDWSFPEVDANASEERIEQLAEKLAADISDLEPAMILCQGEFTLTYHLVQRFKERSLPVCAACSKRRVYESVDENGVSSKKSVFEYTRLRMY